MLKINKSYFVILLLSIIIFSSFVICLGPRSVFAAELDPDIKEKICEEYAAGSDRYTEKDIKVLSYYGNYNGWEVVVLKNDQIDMTTDMCYKKIGDYVFSFGSSGYLNLFLCWQPGSFITVQDAYNTGILSSDDIYKIALVKGDIDNEEIKLYYDIESEDVWFYSYVNNVVKSSLMTGLDENTFGPYEILSRAQFSTILSRMADEQSVPYDDIFNDVAEGEWYTEAVLWAAENDIVTGYENGCFGPADTITREQMAAMLYRYAVYKGYDTEESVDLTEYPDASDVSSFAEEAMSWCVAKGIISGNDGKLLPQGNTTRAECAAMISRFVNLYE